MRYLTYRGLPSVERMWTIIRGHDEGMYVTELMSVPVIISVITLVAVTFTPKPRLLVTNACATLKSTVRTCITVPSLPLVVVLAYGRGESARTSGVRGRFSHYWRTRPSLEDFGVCSHQRTTNGGETLALENKSRSSTWKRTAVSNPFN